MPELDERNERVEEVADGLELGLRLGRLDESRVVLEQDPAELPGELERLERRAELGERRGLLRGLVARHRRVGLDVERELGRSALRPAPGHVRVREVVVRRVHLDGVEPFRVVAEARFRRRDAPRVPGLDEPFVRERARAEADGGGHSRKRRGSAEPTPYERMPYFFLRTTLLFAVNPFDRRVDARNVVPISGWSCVHTARRRSAAPRPRRRGRTCRSSALNANRPFARPDPRASDRLEAGRLRGSAEDRDGRTARA